MRTSTPVRVLAALSTVLFLQLVATAAPASAAPFRGDSCTLTNPKGLMWGGNLGPTNRKQYAIPATGTVKAMMLFADFSDAPAGDGDGDNTQKMFEKLVPGAVEQFRAASHGAFKLKVDAVHSWKRMPSPSGTYDTRTSAGMNKLIRDAVKSVDAQVNFRSYKLVYVVAAEAGAQPLSPAFITLQASDGVLADGVRLRGGAAFGTDARADNEFPAMILAHETGHALGLPDLYNVWTKPDGDWHPWIGGWDQMGNLYEGTGYTQWVRHKLGWLKKAGVTCVNKKGAAARAGTEVTLKGSASKTGKQLVVVPTGKYTALGIEARFRTGLDTKLCDTGVLVYTVNTKVATGKGPMRIVRSGATDTGCGPIGSGTFDRGEGEVCSVVTNGVRVEVVGETETTYRVRVRPSAGTSADPRVASCL